MKEDFVSDIDSILKVVNGVMLHSGEVKNIKNITTDSRVADKDSLFIPIIGENFNAHDFIEQLVSEGTVGAFLTSDHKLQATAVKFNTTAVYCENTLYALGKIAQSHRMNFNIPVVGVTGTNGKTTTKELLSCIMDEKYNNLKNEKNYNNEIGVPFTLFKMNSSHESAVIEMGMNHMGEIERLSGISQPTIAVITNAGEGHLEFLGSIENVAQAKSEIFCSMKSGMPVVLNQDTACFNIFVKEADKKNLKVITYGLDNRADVYPEDYSLTSDSIQVKYKNEIIKIPLYGKHNLYNIMASIACAEELGFDITSIKHSLEKFKNVDKRSEIIDRGYLVINDTYNSNPLSLRSALNSLNDIYPDKRKIAVLSDMKELGEMSEKYHREVGEEVKKNNFEKLYTWGEMSRWIYEGALSAGLSSDSVFYFESKDDLINKLKGELLNGDAVLVKGSRSMKMEEVTEAIII